MAGRLVNLPNVLTTSRIVVLPLMAWLIAAGHGSLACGVLVLAGLTDVFDGWAARHYKQETAIGKLLDPVADKVLLCVAVLFILAREDRSLSPTLATLLLTREFLVTGLRAMAATEGLVISAGSTGKLKAVGQYIGLGALMIGPNEYGFPALQIGLWTLWFSVVLSYVSMYEYIRTAYRELKSKLFSQP